jgi:tetratricopeptide (TPR) repeat protein
MPFHGVDREPQFDTRCSWDNTPRAASLVSRRRRVGLAKTIFVEFLKIGSQHMAIHGVIWFTKKTVGRFAAFVVAFFVLHWLVAVIQAADAATASRVPDVNTELLLPPAAARAWRDVQEAIRDGEELLSPDPEPYYSRAEIWSKRLENQEEALLDTLRGVEAFLEGKDASDPAEIDKALKRLRDAAWLSLQRPKSIYPGAAEKHYGAGLHAYATGQFEESAAHFTRAIQLDASCPEYYYFRSLAHLSAGDRAHAINDAEKGALVESHLTDNARMDVSRSLRRVQGEQRLWLESYRRGRPTYDPRRDETLPARLSPDLRSPRDRSRIKGTKSVDRER